MMARAQVSIDSELHRQAQRRAAEKGISFAEYVRSLLRRDLGSPPPQPSPAAVFNLGDSGGSDVAQDKDALIGRAVASGRGSEPPAR